MDKWQGRAKTTLHQALNCFVLAPSYFIPIAAFMLAVGSMLPLLWHQASGKSNAPSTNAEKKEEQQRCCPSFLMLPDGLLLACKLLQ